MLHLEAGAIALLHLMVRYMLDGVQYFSQQVVSSLYSPCHLKQSSFVSKQTAK